MRKVFISAGHSNKQGRDCGAAGNGYVEGVLAAELRQAICSKLLNIHGIQAITDKDDSILAETLNAFKAITNQDAILIDIHFNASDNPLATGVEALAPAMASSFELALAYDLAKKISADLGIKNRGVKTELQSHHGKLGWMRLQGENVLLEICFISNADDMKKYNTYKGVLAESIASSISFYAKQNFVV